jgi:heme exporter protein D
MTKVMEMLSTLTTMGGYAGYVWPAYGLSVVVMVALLLVSLKAARHNETELEQLQRTRPGRRRRANTETEA